MCYTLWHPAASIVPSFLRRQITLPEGKDAFQDWASSRHERRACHAEFENHFEHFLIIILHRRDHLYPLVVTDNLNAQ